MKSKIQITKQDLYQDGLIGTQNSSYKRDKLKHTLNLPQCLSTKALIEILNRLLNRNGYNNIIKKLYLCICCNIIKIIYKNF